jgi:hypothetical protein
MKAAVIVALAAVVFGFGYHEVDAHHLFAPADPYGPCPAGSHYVSFWQPGTSLPVQSGVIHWMRWTEIASCGASVSITVGS